ncbi:toll/interleukin-1 receptor domain-containing protein [Leptothermofonsia sp. ETS-13]|uniref:toll/interleukin-1 receptor domain-containing protein n=1 Tax=Leptothermofonsia sp. ETS-13 TaxID=3035696 RepID=UPI003B9E4D46
MKLVAPFTEEPGMTDVFISYSRKDKDFVKTLHTALANHNREAWVDWQDIPPHRRLVAGD